VRFLLVIKNIEMFTFSVKSQRHSSFTEFVKWLLPFCPNVETLKLHFHEEPKGLANYIVRLKKLKDLYIGISQGINPGNVTSAAFRNETTLLNSS
jgi:hypothetical protein